MKKIAILLGLLMLTLQGGCQEDKTFKEVVTFEKGFRFSQTGTIQTIPFTGTSTNVTWESITGKPLTFPPAAHQHSYNDLTDKPQTVDLQAAIQSMNVILIPKLTTAQITTISPAAGSLVFDTSLGVLKIGTGTVWKSIITGQ